MLAQPDEMTESTAQQREKTRSGRQAIAKIVRKVGKLCVEAGERIVERCSGESAWCTLLIVTDNDHARREPQQEGTGDVGLTRLVDDHDVE